MKPLEIRKLRESLGKTQTDFGRALGVSKQTICYWESGNRQPSKQSSVLLLLLQDECVTIKQLEDFANIN